MKFEIDLENRYTTLCLTPIEIFIDILSRTLKKNLHDVKQNFVELLQANVLQKIFSNNILLTSKNNYF